MSGKVRHVDYYPDEYIAGIGGQLSAVEQGIYWMICSLVYSRGGPIDDDHIWLSRLFADTHWRTVRSAIDHLVKLDKVERIEGAERVQITVKRCARELQKALTRSAQATQNGGTGGRPPKENNELAEPDGSGGEKLTTNHQPTNQERSLSLSSAKPPAIERKRSNGHIGNRTSEEVDALWRRFREAYPKRDGDQGWKKARERFEALLREGVAPERIIAGAAGYRENQERLGNVGDRARFVKQAVVFLNAQTWAEYDAPAPPILTSPKDDEEAALRLKVGRNRGMWPREKWGPAPNEAGCLIPAALIVEKDGIGWVEWTGSKTGSEH